MIHCILFRLKRKYFDCEDMNGTVGLIEVVVLEPLGLRREIVTRDGSHARCLMLEELGVIQSLGRLHTGNNTKLCLWT